MAQPASRPCLCLHQSLLQSPCVYEPQRWLRTRGTGATLCNLVLCSVTCLLVLFAANRRALSAMAAAHFEAVYALLSALQQDGWIGAASTAACDMVSWLYARYWHIASCCTWSPQPLSRHDQAVNFLHLQGAAVHHAVPCAVTRLHTQIEPVAAT